LSSREYGPTVRLQPNYDAPAALTIDGDRHDQAEPVARQRRRFEALLAGLDDEQWKAPTRCEGWTPQDVAAHLVSVNQFWEASVRAGVAGEPTRVLANFDPAAHPPLLIEPLRALSPAEVFDQFAASNAGFLDALAGLGDADWDLLAESPAGHVSIRLLAHHALWDCWVHERDVALPLGLDAPVERDEVTSSLRYAASIGPYLALSWPERVEGTFGVEAHAPECALTITIDGRVHVADAAPPSSAPVLRGDAAQLADALSVRGSLPDGAPAEWCALVRSLATVFDQ
jgi:uncharacterized protein (TIGR03083 family)